MGTLTRLVIDGYGQVELNQVAFRRDGRVAAQCKPNATDFASKALENGMLLVVDEVKREVRLPGATEAEPVALVYSSEHMYDERARALKNFQNDMFLPRLGYLAVGDRYTTNCISYDSSEFATEALLKTAIDAAATTAVYAGISTDGSHKLSATKPSYGPVMKVRNGFTMPDGTYGVQLVCVGA